MSVFKIITKLLAYDDGSLSTNPSQNYINWAKEYTQDTDQAGGQVYLVDPSASLTVFSGTRTTSIGNDTEFTLTLSPLDSTRYRFTYTDGTAPAFRTDRGLSNMGETITIAVSANQTVSFTSSVAGAFTTVQVGDIVFVPGAVTGDSAGPFNTLNQGFWVVLSKDGTSTAITLSRRTGETFSGYAEAVVIGSNDQLVAYSAVGVQAGDSVNISDGFPSSVQHSFVVDEVTPTWFEVIETSAMPVDISAVPTTSGIAFYTNGKRFVAIEANQACAVRANGSTDDTQKITPWEGNDSTRTGIYFLTGLIWQLVIVNKSTETLKAFVATIE